LTVRSGLARIAAEAKLASPAAIEAAVARSLRSGEPIVVTLVGEARIADDVLTEALARWLKLVPVVSLDPDSDALRELGADTARRLHVLPIAVELPADGPRLLRLAMADPTDEEALDELENATGCRVEPLLCRLTLVDEAIGRAYRGVSTAVMKRPASAGEPRTPFGGDLHVSTPHEPGGRLGTAPFRRLDDDAPLDVRLRALVALLEQKGIIGMVRRLLEGREPG
jgi:hypothetical protein